MTQDELIDSYKPMVDFIADIYGKNCEVILHDLRNLESSIVAIRNNHITGRNISDTVTDFALEIVYNKDKYKDKKFITNYTGRTKDNSRILRASTYFIRDKKNDLIGMLCVNVDITALHDARSFIDELLMENLEQNIINNEKEKDEKDKKENFGLSIDELVNSIINDVLSNNPIEPSRMLIEEKKEIVNRLNKKGVFLLKGSINQVASKLEVSEQTIYRYLKELE
ncbi:helix-turn-helix transcriptional regulator [Maledivibacter halophilus]|uniref:Predicted transcriptional regulator YheO, contains PAS and DNA-binding HTH domains n=1 Tax=Maledivibacter halophilus TaxID=36842 RepID=A0A1T5ICB9_9FIRM|nr:PAS domain-containing protein [Maledivibacter halophilus]SKC36708.1 Predicted transcriptional regulator YheO, contains PAS and DNA-binding HTH domains [Maledivibacter halophilus]